MTQADQKASRTRRDDKDDDECKTRRCLMCGAAFLSQWAGERICRKCKSTSAWRSG